MKLLVLGLVLAAFPAWAQRDEPNGPPSPAVQQQQKQADYARKQHPHSGKPRKPQEASVKTKGKPVHTKPGEASVRIPQK